MQAVKGAHGTVELSRDREMYEPSARGPGAVGDQPPLLCGDQPSGCLSVPRNASTSSVADLANVIRN